MKNSLTVDLEFWWCNEYLYKALPNNIRWAESSPEFEDQVLESVKPLLELLKKYHVKATFFVLGKLAEKHLELIKEISKEHEIASHGYSHRPLHKMTQEEFREEIEKSTNLLQDITGRKPLGYRASNFSLNNSTKWALDILEEFGYRYDSSVFPMKTTIYGISNAPLYPYSPSREDITLEADRNLVEFPITILKKFGFKIPFSGGFYLRVLPKWFLKYSVEKVNKEGRPAIIYVHPRDIYPSTPRLGISKWNSFISYYGIHTTINKLEELFKKFNFVPLKELL